MAKAVFKMSQGQELILASTSPRRKELLAAIGLPFSIFSPRITEPAARSQQNPGEYALLCARLKNEACQKACKGNATILSADTIVAIGDKILGKPANAGMALDMLEMLNGKTHTVHTAFCLHFADGAETAGQCKALVTFRQWPKAVLAAYVATGEPLDKAGSYAIQSRGTFLADGIQGSWTTVVGLPMAEVTSALLERGVIIPGP